VTGVSVVLVTTFLASAVEAIEMVVIVIGVGAGDRRLGCKRRRRLVARAGAGGGDDGGQPASSGGFVMAQLVRADTPVAWRRIVPLVDRSHGPLPAILLALTVVSGMVDAAS